MRLDTSQRHGSLFVASIPCRVARGHGHYHRVAPTGHNFVKDLLDRVIATRQVRWSWSVNIIARHSTRPRAADAKRLTDNLISTTRPSMALGSTAESS